MHISRLNEAIAMKKSLKAILSEDQFSKWEMMKNKKPQNLFCDFLFYYASPVGPKFIGI